MTYEELVDVLVCRIMDDIEDAVSNNLNDVDLQELGIEDIDSEESTKILDDFQDKVLEGIKQRLNKS